MNARDEMHQATVELLVERLAERQREGRKGYYVRGVRRAGPDHYSRIFDTLTLAAAELDRCNDDGEPIYTGHRFAAVTVVDEAGTVVDEL